MPGRFPGAWDELAHLLREVERALRSCALSAADTHAVRRRVAAIVVVARRDAGGAVASARVLLAELRARMPRG